MKNKKNKKKKTNQITKNQNWINKFKNKIKKRLQLKKKKLLHPNFSNELMNQKTV